MSLSCPLKDCKTRSGNRVKGRSSICLQASLGCCKSYHALIGLSAMATPGSSRFLSPSLGEFSSCFPGNWNEPLQSYAAAQFRDEGWGVKWDRGVTVGVRSMMHFIPPPGILQRSPKTGVPGAAPQPSFPPQPNAPNADNLNQ